MSDSDQPGGLVTEIIKTTAVIRFPRLAKRNSLSKDVLDQLEQTLAELCLRDDIKALVFTGTGDVFASGADIVELAQLTTETALSFAKRGQAIFKRIADARQVTIAAINGYCMGGALDLVLACDLRIASAKAVFAHPGAKLGIITGWGGTQRLPRVVGRARALELFCTARRIESEEALDIGLVTEVCDPVLACALEVARRAVT
ncbi:MAG TPA: enoyl-CoA hydratase/isomerase family protein [Pyrinomonadaceae bacterium]|nr:enoyl-CoA hydratase/isomerase family protein [Pyrinomonadaceae bacterium]